MSTRDVMTSSLDSGCNEEIKPAAPVFAVAAMNLRWGDLLRSLPPPLLAIVWQVYQARLQALANTGPLFAIVDASLAMPELIITIIAILVGAELLEVHHRFTQEYSCWLTPAQFRWGRNGVKK